ncbi:hypothetical protein GTW43_07225 [Streptomyces sp. SID5785]|uniref:hypothetical protein n=1 Tax=Streptomyces sp. SID5785 TaxID=2690309 RepID=UPI00136138C4|nr:hypothetical protein [Streptomyces sp. SID5785]MZD04875.1 hypothetical protein [Streptomyces sp. SID5785]
MTNGIAWIGAHHYSPKSAELPGMLGGISLTAARGLEPDEFLMALGADPDELEARIRFRDLTVPVGRPGESSPRVNPVMYGACGEWVYVLEDWGMASWSTGFRKVEAMWPRPGEEVVCLSENRFSLPARILHVPGDEKVRQAEFGADTGEGSALDDALSASGAVFPAIADAGEAAVVAYYEEHGPRLPEAVFTAVGDYCGLSVDEWAVQSGELPGVVIPMP